MFPHKTVCVTQPEHSRQADVFVVVELRNPLQTSPGEPASSARLTLHDSKTNLTSSLLFYPKSEKGNTAFGMSPVAIVVQMIPWEVRTREGTLFHPPEELRIIRHRQVATRALSDAHVNSELATGPDTWTRASAPRQPPI
ncbi:uncharacterized protein LOC118517066 [Anopheles stephensi]|uniref:uncharacterized protein LOC118517066 n=1 Tax=Anopheles stephensi TaxID=30069 RepID=UPI001658A793|nr:uncharacterized protein LOC118517066 [Anopheles stephensi]